MHTHTPVPPSRTYGTPSRTPPTRAIRASPGAPPTSSRPAPASATPSPSPSPHCSGPTRSPPGSATSGSPTTTARTPWSTVWSRSGSPAATAGHVWTPGQQAGRRRAVLARHRAAGLGGTRGNGRDRLPGPPCHPARRRAPRAAERPGPYGAVADAPHAALSPRRGAPGAQDASHGLRRAAQAVRAALRPWERPGSGRGSGRAQVMRAAGISRARGPRRASGPYRRDGRAPTTCHSRPSAAPGTPAAPPPAVPARAPAAAG